MYSCCTDSRSIRTTYHMCQQSDTRVAQTSVRRVCSTGREALRSWSCSNCEVTVRKYSCFNGDKRGVRYCGGDLNRLKWLVHVLMLQRLWFWFVFISRLSDICTLLNLPHDVSTSVWNDGSWPHVAMVLVLVGHHFPSLRYIQYSVYLTHDVRTFQF